MLVYINDKYKDIFSKYKLQYLKEVNDLKLQAKKETKEHRLEKIKRYNKEYKAKHKIAIAQHQKLYKKEYRKKMVETISTPYVKQLLQIKKLKPTDELQSIQRNIILLKRKKIQLHGN